MAGAKFRVCCLEHDCHYHDGLTVYGEPINKAESDLRFLKCHQARSALGWYTPMGWIRYFFVKHFGKFDGTGASKHRP